MTIYEVKLVYAGGSFFTDVDPTKATGQFQDCAMAWFEDSYERTPGWQERRETDARAALNEGRTRDVRVNKRHVAIAVEVPTP